VIIFGYRGGKRSDHGPALPLNCPNCHNQTFYRYLTVTNWFTLFFIPLIPVSSKHYLACPVCTRALQLDKPGRERAAKLVELTALLNAGSIDQTEYLRRVRELGGPTTPAESLPEPGPSLPPPPVGT